MAIGDTVTGLDDAIRWARQRVAAARGNGGARTLFVVPAHCVEFEEEILRECLHGTGLTGWIEGEPHKRLLVLQGRRDQGIEGSRDQGKQAGYENGRLTAR